VVSAANHSATTVRGSVTSVSGSGVVRRTLFSSASTARKSEAFAARASFAAVAFIPFIL